MLESPETEDPRKLYFLRFGTIISKCIMLCCGVASSAKSDGAAAIGNQWVRLLSAAAADCDCDATTPCLSLCCHWSAAVRKRLGGSAEFTFFGGHFSRVLRCLIEVAKNWYSKCPSSSCSCEIVAYVKVTSRRHSVASRRSSTCYYPRHLNHRSGVSADMRRVAPRRRQCENDLRGRRRRRRHGTREREFFLVVEVPVNLRRGWNCNFSQFSW